MTQNNVWCMGMTQNEVRLLNNSHYSALTRLMKT